MRRIKSLAILFIGTSIILLFVDVLLVAGIAALLPWLQVPLDLWAALALSILLLLVVIFTALLFVLAIRHMRASKVVVDEWGLRWKRPNLIKGRSLALAWHEITGFYEITAQESQGGKPVKTYVLDSPASTFSWPLREKSTAKELHASAPGRHAHRPPPAQPHKRR